MLANNKGHKGKEEYECMYSGNGKVPLICASVAFVVLAIAMLVQHSFMLIAISKTSHPVYISWDPQSSRPMKSLTWQAGAFFISTWYVFLFYILLFFYSYLMFHVRFSLLHKLILTFIIEI